MTADEICRALRDHAETLRRAGLERAAEAQALETQAAAIDRVADALGCPPRAPAAAP